MTDAEKVVKALRANGDPATQWMYLNEAADALADFVLAAEAKRDCTCPRWEDTCVCGAEELRKRYIAALARLREVIE